MSTDDSFALAFVGAFLCVALGMLALVVGIFVRQSLRASKLGGVTGLLLGGRIQRHYGTVGGSVHARRWISASVSVYDVDTDEGPAVGLLIDRTMVASAAKTPLTLAPAEAAELARLIRTARGG